MRYLFGDSTPFPFAFDFLKTLEIFMKVGTRVVMLEQGMRKTAEETFAAQAERATGLEALEKFHQHVMWAVSQAPGPGHAFASEYSQRLLEHAASLVEEQRRSAQQAHERDAARTASERTRVNDEVAAELHTFFREARLPPLETRLMAALVDGRPEAAARQVHPGAIGVSFSLNTAKAAAWQAPRKLGDLAGHIELVVGIKKSWIGGKVTREPVRLDDWVVGSTELRESSATIAIRKKPDQKDTLVFELRRDLGAVAADVSYPGDPNATLVPAAAEPSDLPHLERLWTGLRAMFDEIFEERSAISGITLDGEDPLPRGQGQDLIERIVSVLAPTTLQIARRSPNARELSLKREGSDGRREEFYLTRSDLLAQLQPLPREGRAVFAPLGLDDWVPTTSMPPPPVRVPEARVELTSLDLEDA
jgi:hypothetical protein